MGLLTAVTPGNSASTCVTPLRTEDELCAPPATASKAVAMSGPGLSRRGCMPENGVGEELRLGETRGTGERTAQTRLKVGSKRLCVCACV